MAKVFGVGPDSKIEAIIKDGLQGIHTPSKLKDLAKSNFRFLKTSEKNWYGKKTKFVTIVGAAGEEDIPETKLKSITDHYSSDVRKQFNDCLLEDPLLSPSTDRRFDSIFEDGFHLELESAIAFDGMSKRHLTKEESEERFSQMKSELDKFVLQLETWKENIHLLEVMRDSAAVSFGQGNAASLISPGLLDLHPGQLPFSVETIHYSDLGEPIVDIGLTKQMVAIKTKMEGKPICRKDELVYITRNKRGYRKDGKFLGTSPLEPILIISKSIKRIYNYDIPEAVIAAYITKILFSFDEEVEEADARTFITNFLKTGKLAFGMKGVTKTDIIQPKVDVQLIDALEKKLADVALSVVGVPKSMLNREYNLNRDIATIEAIQFKMFVRKPDEQMLADNFESQLFNPLLSINFQRPLNEIPARIKIVRNAPDRDLDVIFEKQDGLENTKTDEINSEQLVQKDAVSIFGASGEKGIIVTPVGDGSYGIRRDNSNR